MKSMQRNMLKFGCLMESYGRYICIENEPYILNNGGGIGITPPVLHLIKRSRQSGTSVTADLSREGGGVGKCAKCWGICFLAFPYSRTAISVMAHCK